MKTTLFIYLKAHWKYSQKKKKKSSLKKENQLCLWLSGIYIIIIIIKKKKIWERSGIYIRLFLYSINKKKKKKKEIIPILD